MNKIIDARFNVPSNFVIAGPSGCGKTTFIINLLQNADKLFTRHIDYIVWFAGQNTQLLTELPSLVDKKLIVVEGLPASFDKYLSEGDAHAVFVIDDMLAEASKSKAVMDLFTKLGHHRSVTTILCLQDLFYSGKERKTFLRNAHYLVVFRNPLDYSVVYALSQKILPQKAKVFIDIFNDATNKPYGYLLLDGHQASNSDTRFRTDIFGCVQHIYVM